jgi:hypothetical protein
MNPAQPQQPQSPEAPVAPPAEPPVIQQVTPPQEQNPPTKSHKKLIIFIVVGALLFFGALGVAGWFFVSQVLPGISGQDSAETSAEKFLSVGDTPEEVYYNNVAVFQWYDSTHDQLLAGDGNGQAAIDLVVRGGRDVCTELANKTLDRESINNKLVIALFATTEGSLCPEQRTTLDDIIAGINDPAVTKDYEESHSYVLDGTVDVDGMLTMNSFCLTGAVFYFGETDTVTREESYELAKIACTALMPEFDSNIEFYEWSAQNEEEKSALIKKFAVELGVCTTLLCRQEAEE